MAAKLRVRRRTGFTLLEMMVGAVVMAIILAAVAAAFIAVQASYQAEAQVKGAVEGGRTGLAYLERTVKMAGYGLDPAHAFSMVTTGLPSATKDNYVVAADGGFQTDDLAFRYRDPAYLRRGTLDTAGTTLTLEGGSFGVELPNGQPLLVACPGGQEYEVVRASGSGPNGGVAASASTATTASYGTPFTTSTASCLTQGGADAPFVMLVHELRLRIRDVGGRPYLVAYRNLSVAPPGADTDYDPIVADVENFQVAYVMNRPPSNSACCSALAAVDSAGNGDWVLGDASGDLLPVETALLAPALKTPYDDPLRYNLHSANVRMVRLSLTLRSSRLEPTTRKAFAPRQLENETVATVADGYFRTVMMTTVRVPNLTSRAFFTPPLRATAADGDLNSWGG